MFRNLAASSLSITGSPAMDAAEFWEIKLRAWGACICNRRSNVEEGSWLINTSQVRQGNCLFELYEIAVSDRALFALDLLESTIPRFPQVESHCCHQSFDTKFLGKAPADEVNVENGPGGYVFCERNLS